MKIFQLRELLTFLKLNDAGNTFTEKRDIVDKIINSGRVGMCKMTKKVC